MNSALRRPVGQALSFALEFLSHFLGGLGGRLDRVHDAGPQRTFLKLVDARYRSPRGRGDCVTQFGGVHLFLAEEVRGPRQGLRHQFEGDVPRYSYLEPRADHRLYHYRDVGGATPAQRRDRVQQRFWHLDVISKTAEDELDL